MKKVQAFLFLVFITFPFCGTYAQSCYDTVDVATNDIRLIPDFNARCCKVFGLRLGMKIPEAKEAVKKVQGFNIFLEQDKLNNDRFYLFERISGDSIRRVMAYCVWPDEDSSLKEITIFIGATDCMVGNPISLFSCDALDPDAEPYRLFFGHPGLTRVDLDIPGAGIRNLKYYYPHKSIILNEDRLKDKVSYSITFYRTYFHY